MKNALGESNWWLIEKDNDKKIFTVIGPIFDDTKYGEKACSLQKQGRKVLIETVDTRKISKNELIEQFRKSYAYVEYDILES